MNEAMIAAFLAGNSTVGGSAGLGGIPGRC